MQLSPLAVQRFYDNNNNPLVGGQLFTYQAGTTTPQATFSDSSGTTANPNPVVMNARGEAPIWLTPTQAYKLVLCDANGNSIWTCDNVLSPAPVTVGNMVDEKGIGGTPGFAAGVDFTPGTTTSLTLSTTYGSGTNIWVWFDAASQGADSYSVSGKTLTFNAPIPVGVNKVYVKGGTALTIGTPASGSVFDSTLASGNKVYNRAIYAVDPRDFGAKGDGVTDDTAAIQAADTWARAQTPPWRVEFSSGTYMATQLVIYQNSNWHGQGKSTILQQITGTNKDFIYGSNSSSNWGKQGSAATGFPFNFTLRDLIIDGGWNGGAGNTQGSGYAVYGDHCLIENVFIRNCAEHGMRTEFQGDSSMDYSQSFLESTFKSIWIDTVGKHGWWDNGPHDSHHIDIHVLDASQSQDSTYDGFYFDAASSARNVSIHPATRSGSLRMRYSLNLQPGAAHEFSGGCNIEGGGVANLGLFGYGNIFDPTTRFYAAWNGVNIYLGGTSCSQNVIRGYLQGPPSGRPACVGIQFSNTTGDSVTINDIDVFMSNQAAGAVYFTAQDGGSNIIRARVYVNANVGIFGTPNPADDIRIWGVVLGGSHIDINTRLQLYSVTVPANGSLTVTYNYSFTQAPAITLYPIGAPASAIQIQSRSQYGVILTNSTSSGVAVDMHVAAPF